MILVLVVHTLPPIKVRFAFRQSITEGNFAREKSALTGAFQACFKKRLIVLMLDRLRQQ